MIGIDTNVLVRYFMQDDLGQSRSASEFIDSLTSEEPGFLSLVTIAELWSVLSRTYRLDPAHTTRILNDIIDSSELVVENSDLVRDSLKLVEHGGADLADCLIACCASHAGCSLILTFDRNAAKSAGMTLLK